MELYDYTVGEVLQLEPTEARNYYALSRTLRPRNVMELEPLSSKPYGYVKTLQTSATYNEPEMLARLQHGREPTAREVLAILKMRFIDYGHQWRHISEELEVLTAKENSTLYSEPTADEMTAGIDKLSIFGVFGIVDTLAGGDPLKYKDVEALPYNVIFAKLYIEKTRAEYRDRYAALIRAKHKR